MFCETTSTAPPTAIGASADARHSASPMTTRPVRGGEIASVTLPTRPTYSLSKSVFASTLPPKKVFFSQRRRTTRYTIKSAENAASCHVSANDSPIARRHSPTVAADSPKKNTTKPGASSSISIRNAPKYSHSHPQPNMSVLRIGRETLLRDARGSGRSAWRTRKAPLADAESQHLYNTKSTLSAQGGGTAGDYPGSSWHVSPGSSVTDVNSPGSRFLGSTHMASPESAAVAAARAPPFLSSSRCEQVYSRQS